jgi:hypothetical protein
MKRIDCLALLAVVVFVLLLNADAQTTGQGRAVITVLSKHGELTPDVTQHEVSARVDGKDAEVTGWTPLKGDKGALELVVLIDAGAHSLGSQLDEIKDFIQGQGPQTKIAVGYMQNGAAVMAGPLSADRGRVAGEIHLPVGPTTNPYFSLSDLAHHWPSQDRNARREVLMLSDGVDPENRRFDPDDLYVQSAIKDSLRAGLVVFTLFFTERNSLSVTVNGGQNLMNELTEATGGFSYGMGTENPIGFRRFFDDLERRFANQYALEFTTRHEHKPGIETFKLKVEGMGVQVTAPQQVCVDHAGEQ